MIIDIKNPIIKFMKLKASKVDCISIISKTKAPNIVGMLNIKENLDASFKLNPNNKAAVIAVPDLEAPGNKARD